jgi:hypothetical protein
MPLLAPMINTCAILVLPKGSASITATAPETMDAYTVRANTRPGPAGIEALVARRFQAFASGHHMTCLCCFQYPAWQRSIIDTAVKAGQFNALAAAVSAGDLSREPVAPRRDADISFTARQWALDPIPLIVLQSTATYRSAPTQLTANRSQMIPHGNLSISDKP